MQGLFGIQHCDINGGLVVVNFDNNMSQAYIKLGLDVAIKNTFKNVYRISKEMDGSICLNQIYILIP